MVDMALNSVRFFRNESCGKCVPCRTGSQKMVDMLTEWTQRARAAPSDHGLLDELSHALRLTSICGLGQVVPVPIASVHEAFPRRGRGARARAACCPAGVCFRIGGGRHERRDRSRSTIDGRERLGPDAGRRSSTPRALNGIPIPTLCHQQNQTPVGVCRVCVVDVGARVLRRRPASASASPAWWSRPTSSRSRRRGARSSRC